MNLLKFKSRIKSPKTHWIIMDYVIAHYEEKKRDYINTMESTKITMHICLVSFFFIVGLLVCLFVLLLVWYYCVCLCVCMCIYVKSIDLLHVHAIKYRILNHAKYTKIFVLFNFEYILNAYVCVSFNSIIGVL